MADYNISRWKENCCQALREEVCPEKNFETGEGKCYSRLTVLKQDNMWWIALYFLGICYMCVCLAIVCDEFFVPALDIFVDKFEITEDVAGATFMAAGGSAPELAISFIGTYQKTAVGFGTIVGSAAFNVLFVIAVCAVCSSKPLELSWWPLARDCSYYIFSLIMVACFFSWTTPQEIHAWEAIVLLCLYVVYVIIMFYNETLQEKFKSVNFVEALQQAAGDSFGGSFPADDAVKPLPSSNSKVGSDDLITSNSGPDRKRKLSSLHLLGTQQIVRPQGPVPRTSQPQIDNSIFNKRASNTMGAGSGEYGNNSNNGHNGPNLNPRPSGQLDPRASAGSIFQGATLQHSASVTNMAAMARSASMASNFSDRPRHSSASMRHMTLIRPGFHTLMASDRTLNNTAGIYEISRIKEGLRATFDQVAKGGDTLDLDGWKKFLELIGQSENMHAKSCFHIIDVENKKSIDYDQFEEWYLTSDVRLTATIMEAFVTCCSSKEFAEQGELSCEFIGRVMCTLGHEVNHYELEGIISELDPNDTSFVQINDFEEWYLKSPFCTDLRAAFAAQAEADDDISFAWPDGCAARIMYVITVLPTFMCWLTLPNAKKKTTLGWGFLTFFGSIIWISLFSICMVDWATIISLKKNYILTIDLHILIQLSSISARIITLFTF